MRPYGESIFVWGYACSLFDGRYSGTSGILCPMGALSCKANGEGVSAVQRKAKNLVSLAALVTKETGILMARSISISNLNV